MSIDATIATWKLSKAKVTATEKLFLLSCADRASEDGVCWPSIKRLTADTCLDRKTVIDVRQSVINKLLLEYTGEMKGKTKLIPVMRLTYVDHRCDNSPENGTANSPENGTLKQSRKRDTEPKTIEPKIGNNTNTESNDSAAANSKAISLRDLINIYHQELPDSPRHNPRTLSTELQRTLQTLIKRWPEIDKENKPLSLDAFRKYLIGLRECAPNLLKEYQTTSGRWKKNNLVTFARWNTVVKFSEGFYS